MLIEFRVSNYRSFKEEQTFSMAASKDDSLPQNVVHDAQGSGYDLLKSAVIYGANASGKSNFIRAIKFMRWFVLNSADERKTNNRALGSPFKLDESWLSKPIRFVVVFLLNGVVHEYGFELNTGVVTKEWLKIFPKGQPRLLFSRDKSKKIKFGSHFKGPKKSLVDKTRSNALFLTIASAFNNEKAGEVLEWLGFCFNGISEDPASSDERNFTDDLASKDDKAKVNILKFLKMADPGIIDFEVISIPLLESELYKSLSESKRKELSERLSTKISETILSYVSTFHNGLDINGKAQSVSFRIEEESAGTRKYYSLAGPMFDVLKNCCTLVADEFDLRLHPLLARRLIEMFHNDEINTKGSQLIFTTHNVSLLDLSLFRRDQVWFTAREEGGETSMFSLWDFKGDEKARKKENIYRSYLAGRYGAIPFLDTLLED